MFARMRVCDLFKELVRMQSGVMATWCHSGETMSCSCCWKTAMELLGIGCAVVHGFRFLDLKLETTRCLFASSVHTKRCEFSFQSFNHSQWCLPGVRGPLNLCSWNLVRACVFWERYRVAPARTTMFVVFWRRKYVSFCVDPVSQSQWNPESACTPKDNKIYLVEYFWVTSLNLSPRACNEHLKVTNQMQLHSCGLNMRKAAWNSRKWSRE